MSKSITLTITEDERADLEALLDAYIAEIKKDQGEHERIMAQVDENIPDEREQFSRQIRADFDRLSERVLRLEMELQHQKEQQATEREKFQLQIENLILRSQRERPSRQAQTLPHASAE